MVVTHGIASYVQQCCNFLEANLQGLDYEILLWSPEEKQKIISWAGAHNIICCTGGDSTLGAAYALLAVKAQGDQFLFLHDDVVLLPTVIPALLEALQNPRVAAAGPYVNRCQYEEQLVQAPDYNDYQGMLAMGKKVAREKKLQQVLFLESFCLLCRREAYEKIGGFSGEFASVGGEDIDLSFRLREAGFELALVPAYVHHERGTLAAQQGEKARPALQAQVGAVMEERWGLNICLPEAMWREALLAFNWQRGGRDLIKASIRSIMLAAPLVSIMIPTYNRPAMFEKTLKSALAQTYPNIEIIVCDNSTNEDTKKLMQKYISDERVRYIWNPEAHSKEENFAPFERLAKGEYLQWCMDDDILLPNKLKKMLGVFAKHPEVTLVTSRRGVIDASDKLYGKALGPEVEGEYGIFAGEEIARAILFTEANVIGEPSAVLFRRRDLQDHYWRADCRGLLAISDVAMWLQLLEKGDFAIFAEPLSYYRRHAQQEGQQPEVVLLARREYVRLAEEYYSRRIFIRTEADFCRCLRRAVEIAHNFTGEALIEVTAEQRQDFLAWLEGVEKRAVYDG